MKNHLASALVWAMFWTATAPGLRAETATAATAYQCAHGRAGQWAWAAPETAGDRKYAPSREIDLLHLALDVTPDFVARTVSGRAVLCFKPIAKPLAELRLDGVNLRVTTVTASEPLAAWQATDSEVVLTFEPPVPADREATVTIVYSAEPKRGLYFRTPELGYPAGDAHLWTQGEPLEARHWFPSFDAPNEKFTSEVTCRVRPDMTVLSNGRRVSEGTDPATGLKVVTWLQDKPHVTYLIALVAGYLKGIEDKHRDIPLAFYTPASQIEYARNSFEETKEMLAFFEQEIGVPYPWAKYDQVCVDDFGWGGMENTTLTILNDGTLHSRDREQLGSSRGLVAHELAHQWFGDLVTCKDWSHLWLNEGFATYYTHLYEGHKEGRDEMLYGLYESARGIIGQPNDTNAIVRRDFGHPEEQFGFRAYPKGAWILHMLRSQLGEDLYRRCIRTYVQRHQFGNVVTEDLNQVIEEISGRSFDQFFDQYVYHAHHPELAVTYSWDQRTKLARITVRQDQKLSDDVLLFNVPLTVRFKGKFGTMDREVRVREKEEDFYQPLPGAPELVRVDPNLALLARISFTPPTAMLLTQLRDMSDGLGRILAAEALGGKREAMGPLQEALNTDPFYAVRLAAVSAIRAMPGDDGLRGLLDAAGQPDARVRRQLANTIAGYHRDEAFTNLLRVIREEKNPVIQAAAISRLAGWPRPDARDLILGALQRKSHRNLIEEAALTAARGQDDPALIGPILELLGRRENDLESAVFQRGLDTVAWLGRHESNKDVIREFLLARAGSPRERTRVAALAALGTLGDDRAIAILEKFLDGPKSAPERPAAERSLAALRAERKPSAELGGIRTELLGLQRENRELRKDLDDLRKKLDALVPKASGTNEAAGAPAARDGKSTRPAPKAMKR